jgi:uncharacterized RDD family membrane protein YckC
VDFEERYVTDTPEGVPIDLALAGPATRMLAYALDALVIAGGSLLLFVLAALVGGVTHSGSALDFGIAVAVVAYVAGQLGAYFVFFEVLGGGTSIGKRALGLRVVDKRGGAIGLRRSLVRNVLRLVDSLPSLYAVGVVTVVTTRHNQRLGDLAAGTLVIRSRPPRRQAPTPASPAAWAALGPTAVGASGAAAWATPPVPVLGWDVTAVTAEEIAVVRQFLYRRFQLPPAARYGIAVDLATRLWTKVAGQPPWIDPERFLEQVTTEKLGAGR